MFQHRQNGARKAAVSISHRYGEVFEHIPEPKEGLLEVVLVLKPGGYNYGASSVQLLLKMHLCVFRDTKGVLELCRDVGLNVLDLQEKEYQFQTE